MGNFWYPRSTGGWYTVLALSVLLVCLSVCLSVLPSVPSYISSHFSQQLLMAEIWYLVSSFIYVPHIVASVFGPIRFLLPVCRLDFYTHWTYMLIFRRIFLSHYWWQKSYIWSQASYRYPISWEAFLDPSDSYFLFADFVNFSSHLTYICICTFFVAFF